MCLATAGGVQADQWYVEPGARLYGFYEDNVRLQSNGPISSTGVIARAEAKAGRRTEANDIALKSAVENRQYFDANDLNTTDFFLEASGLQRIERDRFTLDARLDLDSTLTSEVEGSGRVHRSVPRTRWVISPGWEHDVTERLETSLNATYEDVSYDNGLRFGYVDYLVMGADAGVSYGLSETTHAIGRFSLYHYEAGQLTDESDTTGVLAGIAHAFSETFTVTALAGIRRTKAEYAVIGGTVEDTNSGQQYDLSLSKRFETARLDVRLSREIQPTSSSGLLDTVRSNIRWNQEIDARWSWSMDFAAQRTERVLRAAQDQNRDYLSLQPQVNFRFDRDWRIEGGYRYRYQKYETNPSAAEANAVFLTLRYAPQREGSPFDLTDD